MNRRIITRQLQATTGEPPDTYSDMILKSIPAEIVAAWVAVKGLVDSASNVSKNTILWVCFAVGVVLTFLWTRKQTQGPGQSVKQLFVATGAFIIWVFALGPPFSGLTWYHPLYASLALIGYTLITPLVYTD
ncbi:MAG: hypothetical protein C5B58_08535 [Acidobacteria bacterium]|nr:MAG: hypothetical protein C5B58_08535 [Acidobacteriota bacterium]